MKNSSRRAPIMLIMLTIVDDPDFLSAAPPKGEKNEGPEPIVIDVTQKNREPELTIRFPDGNTMRL